MEKEEGLVLKKNKSEKFLEHKSKREYKPKKKWKPYKDLTYEERKHLSDREATKDHLKQDLRNNPKLLKNLDFCRKNISHVNKPNTPHNTSQYLTSNYSQGRNEKVGAFVNEFCPDYQTIDEEMPEDYMNQTDDYCIPGGSMRDVIMQQVMNRDLDFNAEEGQNENEYGIVPSILHYLPTQGSIQDNNTNENEIEKYKRIIEQQQMTINMLNEKLKNANSEVVGKDIP